MASTKSPQRKNNINLFEYRKVFADNYKMFLEDLQVRNIRDNLHRERLISNLTLLAYQDRACSEQIVDVIRNQFRCVCPKSRILIIYLIHSIVTSVGGKYINLFNKHIVRMFNLTMKSADSDSCRFLFTWREKWDHLFSEENLYRIDSESRKIDSRWPILEVRSVKHMIRHGKDSFHMDIGVLKRKRDSLVAEIEYCRRFEVFKLDPIEEHSQKKRKIDEMIPKPDLMSLLQKPEHKLNQNFVSRHTEKKQKMDEDRSIPVFGKNPELKSMPSLEFEEDHEPKQKQTFTSKHSEKKFKQESASKQELNQSESSPEEHQSSLKIKIDLKRMKSYPMHQKEHEKSELEWMENKILTKRKEKPSIKCSIDLSKTGLPASTKATENFKYLEISSLITPPPEDELTENPIHKMDISMEERSKQQTLTDLLNSSDSECSCSSSDCSCSDSDSSSSDSDSSSTDSD